MCPAAAPADETLGEFAGLGMGIHERGALYKVGPARTPLRRAATGAWPSLKLAAARHRACDRADNPLHMVLEGQTLYGEQHQKQKNQELGPCFHANRPLCFAASARRPVVMPSMACPTSNISWRGKATVHER